MPHQDILTPTLVLFGAAIVVAWLCQAARAPAVIGFLLSGIVIGPSGLRLISQDAVGQFAEIGLVLLLFTVGLELSPEPLVRAGLRLVVGTSIQIAATAGLTFAAIQLIAPMSFAAAALLGVAVSLSSTAIVLKKLSEQREIDTPAGTITTGVLLLQDVAVIVLMLVMSLLAASAAASWTEAVRRSVIAVFAIFLARWALPTVLRQVFRHGGRELATLFAVVMACAGAWLAGWVGWSWPLGACISGLLLSQADERHQLAAEITPFREVFNALFFISLGMLVDLRGVAPFAAPLALAIAATLVLKSIITAGAIVTVGWPLRLGIQVGLGLCTVSEFGYVLAREAHRLGVLEAGVLNLLIAYAVGTMLIGTLLIPIAGRLSAALAGMLSRRPAAATEHEAAAAAHLSGHVVIVGYGLNGQNLSRVLRATKIEHCVVEMNPRLVAMARADGERVIVGDASRSTLLEHAGIAGARALVVAINDPLATRRIVGQARVARPDLYVLARTRHLSELDALYQLGAAQVIPEEFETSIEIFAHLLKELAVPDNVVEAQVAMVRAGRYGTLRGRAVSPGARIELLHLLEATATQTFLLDADSPVNGKTIRDLHLRAATGVTIIAVVRAGKPTTNPPPDWRFEPGDVLVLVGAHAQLDAAKKLLAPAGKAPADHPASPSE